MTTSKATPRPWHVGKTYRRINRRIPIYPDTPTIGQLVVCEAGGEDAEANTALIVTAVNAYDAMHEALRLAIHGLDTDGPASAAATLNVQGRAALAAAEGKVE